MRYSDALIEGVRLGDGCPAWVGAVIDDCMLFASGVVCGVADEGGLLIRGEFDEDGYTGAHGILMPEHMPTMLFLAHLCVERMATPAEVVLDKTDGVVIVDADMHTYRDIKRLWRLLGRVRDV